MGKYFNGWRERKFIFINREVKRKFESICVKPTGAVYLHELIRAAGVFDYQFPEELEARSYFHPDTQIEPSHKYASGGKMQNVDEAALNRAYDLVKRMFKVEKVHPISLDEVEYEKQRSSGLPLLTTKEKAYEAAKDEALATLKGQAPQPCLMGNRGKSLTETRIVWMFPFSMTLIESMYFQPLQEAIMRSNTPWAGAMRKLNLACRLNEVINQSHKISLLDYSGFDGSIPARLISMAFNILEDNFEMNDYDKDAWELIKRYFITTPIVAPDGMLYTGKRHGVPSGSMFTQLIDSVVNALAITYVSLVTRCRVTRFYVLGDDSVIGWKLNAPSLDQIADIMLDLGITVNAKKSKELSTEHLSLDGLHFLGHTWNNLMPDRPIDEVMKRLVTPERVDFERTFSKDPQIRREYLLERIKAYMYDSQEAFPLLARLWDYFSFPEMPVKRCGVSYNLDWTVNSPSRIQEAYLSSVDRKSVV